MGFLIAGVICWNIGYGFWGTIFIVIGGYQIIKELNKD